MTGTHTLETPEAALAYDVRGPLPTADGRPPLFLVAAPMDASGFGTLASHFPDRTVVTYDARGLGRSTRHDGRPEHTPEQNADICTASSRRSAVRWRCSPAAVERRAPSPWWPPIPGT
jgi:pimeloyl-ACP methyl ester carboxylesterase